MTRKTYIHFTAIRYAGIVLTAVRLPVIAAETEIVWDKLYEQDNSTYYIMSTEQIVLRNHLCETFGFTSKNSIKMPFLGSRH